MQLGLRVVAVFAADMHLLACRGAEGCWAGGAESGPDARVKRGRNLDRGGGEQPRVGHRVVVGMRHVLLGPAVAILLLMLEEKKLFLLLLLSLVLQLLVCLL